MSVEKQKKLWKMYFVFTKTGLLRYISHRDLMRLLMRAARRANLPLYFTEGFSPHVKLSIQRAIKLGIESEYEEAALVLVRPMLPVWFRWKLNRALPQGIRIKQAHFVA